MANVIDTPTGIDHIQLFARRQAVHLEGLGMRRSGNGRSALAICKAAYGLTGNRANVLAQLDAMIAEGKATHSVWTVTCRDETGAEGDAVVEFGEPVNGHHCHVAARAEFGQNGWTVVKVAPVVE